ncbi:DUF397 domain-containing protein [Streptomyces sp. NPDC089799]|uniref:DUF397 domain-containing protein n=1 Tax=Streptomyces sp. NPDC089799 TaxID=3155066 RepID=UPI003437E1B6
MPIWKKSSYCGEGEACVLVASEPETIRVTDGTWTVMSVTPDAWTDFLRSLRA